MRHRLEPLGRGNLVILITCLAIVFTLGLNTAIIYFITHNFEHLLRSNIKAFVIALIVTPLLSWYLVGLLYKLDKLEKEMTFLASYDSLTGLFNRRAFFVSCDIAYNLAQRNQQPYSILAIDMDFFKQINDQFGHACGDKVLAEFGELLCQMCRESDIKGRLGGEEFAVFLPNTICSQAEAFAEKLRQQIHNQKLTHQDNRISVTISIGISTSPAHEFIQVEQILNQADEALYQAKGQGRNIVAIFKTAAVTA